MWMENLVEHSGRLFDRILHGVYIRWNIGWNICWNIQQNIDNDGTIILMGSTGKSSPCVVHSVTWCRPACMWICVQTHVHARTCAHAHMHTCTHAHMHTCTHTHTHARARARAQTHTNMHTCTDTHAHTCLHMHRVCPASAAGKLSQICS